MSQQSTVPIPFKTSKVTFPGVGGMYRAAFAADELTVPGPNITQRRFITNLNMPYVISGFFNQPTIGSHKLELKPRVSITVNDQVYYSETVEPSYLFPEGEKGNTIGIGVLQADFQSPVELFAGAKVKIEATAYFSNLLTGEEGSFELNFGYNAELEQANGRIAQIPSSWTPAKGVLYYYDEPK